MQTQFNHSYIQFVMIGRQLWLLSSLSEKNLILSNSLVYGNKKKKLFFFLPVFQPWAKCVTSRQQCTTGCILFTSSKSDVATEYLSRESSLCNWWRYWDWQRHDNSLVQFGCQVCYSKPVNINKHILELSFSIEC